MDPPRANLEELFHLPGLLDDLEEADEDHALFTMTTLVQQEAKVIQKLDDALESIGILWTTANARARTRGIRDALDQCKILLNDWKEVHAKRQQGRSHQSESFSH